MELQLPASSAQLRLQRQRLPLPWLCAQLPADAGSSSCASLHLEFAGLKAKLVFVFEA